MDRSDDPSQHERTLLPRIYTSSDPTLIVNPLHHTTDKITHHTTAFITPPVVEHWLEEEIAQWFHLDGSIRRSIATRADALTTDLHLVGSNPHCESIAASHRQDNTSYRGLYYTTSRGPLAGTRNSSMGPP